MPWGRAIDTAEVYAFSHKKQRFRMPACHFGSTSISSVCYLGWPPVEVLLWTAHGRLWRAECQSSTPRREVDKPQGGRKVMKAVSMPPGLKSKRMRDREITHIMWIMILSNGFWKIATLLLEGVLRWLWWRICTTSLKQVGEVFCLFRNTSYFFSDEISTSGSLTWENPLQLTLEWLKRNNLYNAVLICGVSEHTIPAGCTVDWAGREDDGKARVCNGER